MWHGQQRDTTFIGSQACNHRPLLPASAAQSHTGSSSAPPTLPSQPPAAQSLPSGLCRVGPASPSRSQAHTATKLSARGLTPRTATSLVGPLLFHTIPSTLPANYSKHLLSKTVVFLILLTR